MSEARYVRSTDLAQVLAGNTLDAYGVYQLPGGEAAFLDQSAPVTGGGYTDQLRKRAQVNIAKAPGVVLLAGQRAFWDYANNRVTYKKAANNRDFLAGTVAEDATSAATTALVDLNRPSLFDVDVARDSFLSAVVGTQGLNTMGVFRRGGAHKLILSVTNEAQKVDVLSVDDLKTTAKTIVEGTFRVVNGGAAGAPDFNIGVAGATHATDADAIAEHCFFHLDGNSTTISAQSKDPTTTVTAVTTGTTYTAGSGLAARVHFLMDLRNLASVKLYLNGAQVATGSTFRLDNAVGPLFLLAHLEKTAAADQFEVDVDWLRSWNAEQ